MSNLKPFDPNDVDETLTRVIMHDSMTYHLFPYINALGKIPKFESIERAIEGPAATIEDFAALAGLITQSRSQGQWFLSFNTPWLIAVSEAEKLAQRVAAARSKRF